MGLKTDKQTNLKGSKGTKRDLIHCVYLNLDKYEIPHARDDLDLHLTRSVDEAGSLLSSWNYENCCLIIGVSRNLMDNYMAIASFLFSGGNFPVPFVLVSHYSNRIEDYKAFLFGRKPFPLKKIDRKIVDQFLEISDNHHRSFERIPVTFIAFVQPENGGEGIPVVCKNISWLGTYFETREELEAENFILVLRSRLHRIEIPFFLTRKVYIETPPARWGYGATFKIPLPLTLIQYMFAKYLKDKKQSRK